MKNSLTISNILSWFFGLVFISIGILNIIHIDLPTGIFYFAISILFVPPFEQVFRRYFKLYIPYILRIILAFIVLWITLAVGDLAEIYGL